MKVEDYEYIEENDLEEEILTDEKKDKIIKRLKDQVIRGNIALYKILEICKNDKEYDFAYKWLAENDITIRGINGTLSEELEKYDYIKRLGKIELPKPLEKSEQHYLFMKLDEMKKNGIDTDSKEYQEVRQKLIVHNMRLAIWTVMVKYRNELKDFGLETEDLKQIAMEALIESIDKYDANLGYEFSSYAVPRMRYSISNDWRKSENNSEQKRKEWKMLEVFEEEMLKNENRMPTDDEIKEVLGIGNERLESLKNYINLHSSESFEKLNDDDKEKLINNLLDDEKIEEDDRNPISNGVYIDDEEKETLIQDNTKRTDTKRIIKSFNKDINKALKEELMEHEKKVITLRFGLDGENAKTLEETGKELNVTRERIRQIEAKALRKLRYPYSRRKMFKDYLYEIEGEEWEKYDGLYEDDGDKSQIVDGIKIENYDFKAEKAKRNLEEKKNNGIQEDEVPEAESEQIDAYKGQLEQENKIEKHNSQKSYSEEITGLLDELEELNEMLKQTSSELKSEKDKKQRNKELKKKMLKVKELIER